MSHELDGKRAVITAGADGIGRAMVRAFMASGARVHISDIDGDQLAGRQDQTVGLGATPAHVPHAAPVDPLARDARVCPGCPAPLLAQDRRSRARCGAGGKEYGRC